MTKEEQWITKAVSLLKQVEYAATANDVMISTRSYHVCPICGSDGGHKDSCNLNELLKGAEEII